MDAYIIKGYRTAVGKAPRGKLRFIRPDELGALVIKHLMGNTPEVTHKEIDDVVTGNAMPEAEQGLNMSRFISLLGLDTDQVPGMTVNRYCASGLETLAISASKINAGLMDCIISGGVEMMSPIPFGGWNVTPNYSIAKEHPDWYWGMGLTAEAVAEQFKITREEQDEFAFNSHQKALNALKNNLFKDEVVPVNVKETFLDQNEKKQTREYIFDTEEGPRADTSIEKLARLKPVFKQGGSVTAGNSSQTSDGAAFLMVASEDFVKKHNLKPMARLVSYSVAGLEPRIMGAGPIYAIPKALKKAGLQLNDIEQIELNEAFASQAVAVVKELGINPELVNVNGGAIALGHPLGCTGSKLTVQLLHEMQRRKQKYGMVSMCVGTGQGAAGIFELLN